jgi:carboxyl-terminal processing protease
MKYRNLIVAVLAVFLVSGSAFAQEKEKPINNVETYRLLDLFGEVFERVRSGYVEAPTDQELIESAIAGMLTSLDPHSSYLSAKSFQDMQVQTRGEFGGLGIEVTMEAGLVKVVSPIDGTPAHRAGLKPGDFISHLEGKPILGLTLAEAVEKMRGKVGTDLRLTIRRKGTKEFDVTVTRAVIQIRSVRSRMEGDIGYLRITSFNEQADKGSIKAIAEFKKNAGDKLKGLVLDLRNNPGGLLDQSVKISDLFLDKGEIVSTRSRRPEDTQRFNAHTGDLMNGLPVVVLINGGSASASEIVAGALQDHGRAILMGTKTFGKGSVQTIMPLSGHGAMRLTTARYYTPSGRSIQAVGIEPDIKVEQARIESLAAQQTRREADLKGALKNEEKAAKNEEDKSAEEKAKEKPVDYQLSRALDLLRGLSLFNKTAGLKNQKAEAAQ